MKIAFYLERATRNGSHAWLIATALAFHTLILGASSLGDEASPATVTKTIRQLGAKSFLAREDAAQQLLYMGVAAESALAESARSADREVRDRARRVLQLIRKQKRTGLLANFRNATESPSDSQFPGWSRFVERYGDGVAGRKIFAAMLDNEWDLIDACFGEENDFQRRNHLMDRYRELIRRGLSYNNCQLGTALALFYVCREFPASAGTGLQQNLFNYMRNPEVSPLLLRRAKADIDEQNVVRELVGDWVIAASEPSLNDRNARTALQYARIYKLDKPSKVIAQRVLADAKSLPMTKNNAMQSVVLRNDKTQLNLIEPFLEDRTLLGTSGQRVRQLRDVALACAMQLNGHDVTEIGVKPMRSGTISAFDYQSLGFITEGDRQKAFETYRKLQARKEQRQ